MKPHKHCEVIKAWADGAEIECRASHCDLWIYTGNPGWAEDIQYRIKPQTIRYRVALFKDHLMAWVNAYLDEDTAQVVENSASFVKWLSDWTEVTV